MSVRLSQGARRQSRRFRIEFGIPNEIIRKYSETAWKFFRSGKVWKFELCNFLCRKKLGKLDLSFLIAEKDAEIWTLSFFRSEKVRKFELGNFLCRKKCGKLDFIIFIGNKSTESWTLSFLLAEKARKVELYHF